MFFAVSSRKNRPFYDPVANNTHRTTELIQFWSVLRRFGSGRVAWNVDARAPTSSIRWIAQLGGSEVLSGRAPLRDNAAVNSAADWRTPGRRFVTDNRGIVPQERSWNDRDRGANLCPGAQPRIQFWSVHEVFRITGVCGSAGGNNEICYALRGTLSKTGDNSSLWASMYGLTCFNLFSCDWQSERRYFDLAPQSTCSVWFHFRYLNREVDWP